MTDKRRGKAEVPSESRGGNNPIESISFFESSVSKTEMGHFSGVWVGGWVYDREFDERVIEAAQLRKENHRNVNF